VFSDVCEVQTMMCEGFRYFITFVDDFSHFLVIYPMKNKSVKMGRKPREGILCSLPCLIPRVRAMSEAWPNGSSNLSSRCAMNVLMKRSGSLALATP